jgi:Arm DNA-binding domain
LRVQKEITDTWLRGLMPPQIGRLEIWDTRAVNLVLRLTPNGTATWSVRTRTLDGKRTRPKIGTWPAVGIQEARKRARAVIAEIQGGGDPVASKRTARAEREARAGLPSVVARLKEWRETRAKAWSQRYLAEVERICDREIIPVLGKRALVETSRADWADLIAKKHKKAPGVGSMLYRTASSKPTAGSISPCCRGRA